MELGSSEEARAEALRAIPALAADLLREGTDPMACELIIEDRSHDHQMIVRFTDLVRAR
jgi:hypothetical protein